MSRFELHVRDFNDIDKYLNFSFDVLSVGDEGCIHKTPLGVEALNIANKIIDNGSEFKFITPKVADKYIGCLLETIEMLTTHIKQYTLVVNDTGLLYICNKKGVLPNRVFLGRSISRSLEDTPWSNEYIKEEENKLDILANNLADEPKIKFMNKYKINGIESNLLPTSEHGFKRISEYGWEVSAHIGNSTLAFTRSCSYARFKNLEVGCCEDQCKEGINISMEEISDGQAFCPCKKPENSDLLDFYLLGNILYTHPNKESNQINHQYVNNYVLHTYDYTYKEIQELDKSLTKE